MSYAQVLIGGETCKVVEINQTAIRCISPQAVDRAFYSGGRGIHVEIFPEFNSLDANLTVPTEQCKLNARLLQKIDCCP